VVGRIRPFSKISSWPTGPEFLLTTCPRGHHPIGHRSALPTFSVAYWSRTPAFSRSWPYRAAGLGTRPPGRTQPVWGLLCSVSGNASESTMIAPTALQTAAMTAAVDVAWLRRRGLSATRDPTSTVRRLRADHFRQWITGSRQSAVTGALALRSRRPRAVRQQATRAIADAAPATQQPGHWRHWRPRAVPSHPLTSGRSRA